MVLPILAVLFVLAALATATNTPSYIADSTFSNRFKTDNAVGATANAVEFLAHNRGSQALLLLIAALLCWLTFAVVRLRHAVERRV